MIYKTNLLFLLYVIFQFVTHGKSPASLERITEFRQQHRKTLDGRLCASAFLHADQTYTDCTDAVSPDGTSGREWCYVEVQLLGKGTRDWDYCASAINYDKLRMQAKKVFEGKSVEADRLKERLSVLNSRVYSMVQKYDSVCGKKHELISSRIEKINEWLTKSEDSLAKIEEHSNNIEFTKNTIDKLQVDIRNETTSSKQAAENCETSPGYENEPISDGLRVSYFNSAFFEGIPVETKIDKNVNFIYHNRGPLDNISPYKYSIRYEGYLLAPHNGTYILTTQTDCAVRIFLNNKCILIHGFEEMEENEYTSKPVRYSTTQEDKSEIIKKNSKPVELIGGEKHRIVIEVSHSSHLKFKNGESATFKLLWKSSRIDEQIIESHYFFSENVLPPSRVSALNPEFFEIGLVHMNERAFKNNDDWIISKVPTKYIGLHLIRPEEKIPFDQFSLSINTGSNLFIAFSEKETFPLSPTKDSLWKVLETDDVIELSTRSGWNKMRMKVKFIPLKNKASLNFQVLNRNASFIMFTQQRKVLPTICSGEEEILSDPSNKAFKECTESSALTSEFGCMSALSNLHMDKKFGVWRTLNGSIGQFIQIFFTMPVQISKFRFKPRDDLLTWPSEISLIFDDSEVLVPVLHTSNMYHNTFQLEHPVITTSVKVEIRDMFIRNEETGGSFEFLGNSCDITDQSLYASSHAIIDIIDCPTTLLSIPDVLPLIHGDKFLISCDPNCIQNLSGEVYGSDFYASESSLCKASVHAGACNPNETSDSCKFLIRINNKTERFTGNLQNNVMSSNLSKSASLSFSASSLISPKNPQLYATSPNSYSVVFKTKQDVNFPNRYLVDTGDVFKDYGEFAYGWNKPITDMKSRNLQTNVHSNVLYSGGINFPPASASEQCISASECKSNFWKFKTHENGTYAVQVLIGNNFSNERQKAFIEINGLPLAKNIELNKNEYFVAVENVQVTDRSLIFTSTCLEKEHECSNARTAIMAVQILKV